MKNTKKQHSWFKRLCLVGWLCAAPVVSACAPSRQQLSSFSSDGNVASDTQAHSSRLFPTPEHTANYFSPQKTAYPKDVDYKFAILKDLAIDSNFILTGRQFKERVSQLTDQQIKDDLVDSLIDIVTSNPGFSIDFSTLNISFLSKYNENRKQKEVESFLLEMTVSNNDVRPISLFGGISIAGKSLVQLSVSLLSGYIAQDYGVINDLYGAPNASVASWQLRSDAYNFYVVQNYLEGPLKNNKIEAQTEDLKLIFAYSYALNTLFVNFSKLPDYASVNEVAKKYIRNLSPVEFKKDLNYWFMYYLRHQFLLGFEDLKIILRFILNSTLRDMNGVSQPMLKLIVEEPKQRNLILNSMKAPAFVGELLNKLLTVDKKGQKPNYEKFLLLVHRVLEFPLDQFLSDGLDIKVLWYQEPAIDYTDPRFPKVSFDTKVQVTFKRDLVFALQGKGVHQGKEIVYNFDDYLNIANIFGFGAGKMTDDQKLLAGILQLISFQEFAVHEGEGVALRYTANNSPMLFAATPTIDSNRSNLANFGLNIADLQLKIDLSNLSKFFEHFYRSLNKIDYSGSDEPISALVSIASKARNIQANGDAKFLFELLSFLFVKPEDRLHKLKNGQRPSYPRPIELIVQLLLEKEFIFDHASLTIPITNAFYYLPDSYNGKRMLKPIGRSELQRLDAIGAISSGYRLNEAITLESLMPKSKDDPNSGDLTNLTESQKLERFKDQPYFDYIWKDPILKNYFDNYNPHYFTSSSVVFSFDKADAAIKQVIEGIKDDSMVPNAINTIKQIVASNISYDKQLFNVEPQVSVMRIPLNSVLQTLLHQEIKASAGGILSFGNGLFKFFGNHSLEIKDILKNFVKLDPYWIVINFPMPTRIFDSNDKGQIYFDSSSSYVGSTLMKFVAPILDPNEIRTPHL